MKFNLSTEAMTINDYHSWQNIATMRERKKEIHNFQFAFHPIYFIESATSIRIIIHRYLQNVGMNTHTHTKQVLANTDSNSKSWKFCAQFERVLSTISEISNEFISALFFGRIKYPLCDSGSGSGTEHTAPSLIIYYNIYEMKCT